MKNLFLRHLHLWPRYHSTVSSVLASCQPQVVEIHLHLTAMMQDVQTAVLDLISFTLKEVKRLNPNLNSEELTVENSMSKSFHKILQRELDPVWHQLSGKSRQLVSDLKTLRLVLTYLTQYDCITFYNFVSTLRTTESAMKSGGWVLLDSAETLFLTARDRVFGNMENNKKKKGKAGDTENLFEENPKWTEIGKVIEEIKDELVKDNRDPATETVMIVTRDERTARQVNDYLSLGSQFVLGRMFNKCLGEKFGFLSKYSEDNEPKNIKEFKDKGKGKKSSEKITDDLINDNDGSKPQSLVTTFHSLDSCESFDTFLMLTQAKPGFIILYDCDMTFVRQVEAFQAANTDLAIRVYFLLYKGSVEEQAYLTTLRREKVAFESLIKAKTEMVVPEDREGRDVDNSVLARGSDKASDLIMGDRASTRRGGQEKSALSPRVIVDMREFRSELPSLLHKRGMDVEPVTLEVGDYILTPEICVERKSISDLIGSLNSGRLYNQATSMSRFYTNPMLLIEFDTNKPFSLQGKYYMSRDVQSSDLSKILMRHFVACSPYFPRSCPAPAADTPLPEAEDPLVTRASRHR